MDEIYTGEVHTLHKDGIHYKCNECDRHWSYDGKEFINYGLGTPGVKHELPESFMTVTQISVDDPLDVFSDFLDRMES